MQIKLTWFATQICWYVSIWHEFILKRISEQTTNFSILAYSKEQKVLALSIPHNQRTQ